MCGRYVITLDPAEYRNLFGYPDLPNFPPRHNVAPTQPVPIVLEEGDRRRFRLVRWGFLPGWLKDPKGFPLLINARAETIGEKATFRAALRHRRCVFLADGFYEWRRGGPRGAAPFLVRPEAGGPLPLAGLWETWTGPDGEEMDTAAIVTTAANGTLAALHERMPVILDRDGIAPWLDVRGTDTREALALCRPTDAPLTLTPMNARVNDARQDDPGLIVSAQTQAPPAPKPSRRRPAGRVDAQGSLL